MTAIYIDRDGRQYPLVDTYIDTEAQPGKEDVDLLLICPFCGRGHQHGTSAKEGRKIAALLIAGRTFFEGHRVPHCNEHRIGESYTLNVIGFVTPEFDKEWRASRRKAPSRNRV